MIASGVNLYKDCLNVTYDTRGFVYEIPNYCINDPSSYNIIHEDVKPRPAEQTIILRIRKYNDTYKVSCSNHWTVLQLKEHIVNSKTFGEISSDRVRLFCAGKEWSDDAELWSYPLIQNSIIQFAEKPL